MSPDEYPRLAGTEAEHVWPLLDPADRVVVVERDGAIVAVHVLMRIWHLECLWKAADAGTGVTRLLWSTMQQLARSMNLNGAWTTALDDRVVRLLGHVGAEALPGRHFVVPFKG